MNPVWLPCANWQWNTNCFVTVLSVTAGVGTGTGGGGDNILDLDILSLGNWSYEEALFFCCCWFTGCGAIFPLSNATDFFFFVNMFCYAQDNFLQISLWALHFDTDGSCWSTLESVIRKRDLIRYNSLYSVAAAAQRPCVVVSWQVSTGQLRSTR